ncbi:MAG TPA: hypothetical protein ENH60_10930 [Pricia sp.]|nr:hypothetical protein [Pricia sp.]
MEHTQEVFTTVQKIGSYENSSVEELEPLLLSTLFHDIFANHEAVSVRLAIEFLLEHNYPNFRITTVIDCINATHMPQKPRLLHQKIICDADLHHLGTRNLIPKIRRCEKNGAYF